MRRWHVQKLSTQLMSPDRVLLGSPRRSSATMSSFFEDLKLFLTIMIFTLSAELTLSTAFIDVLRLREPFPEKLSKANCCETQHVPRFNCRANERCAVFDGRWWSGRWLPRRSIRIASDWLWLACAKCQVSFRSASHDGGLFDFLRWLCSCSASARSRTIDLCVSPRA